MPNFRPCVCCVSKDAVSSWNFTRVTAGPCVGNPLWEADNARHAPVTRRAHGTDKHSQLGYYSQYMEKCSKPPTRWPFQIVLLPEGTLW